MKRSGYKSRSDTEKLVDALAGLEVKQGADFPQGDLRIRKSDHQGLVRLFIEELKGGHENIIATIPMEKLDYEATCKA
jgi:hypothetical protein